ncbi:hypothetical protein OSTOST_22427 [Ostertagia ostertagi]
MFIALLGTRSTWSMRSRKQKTTKMTTWTMHQKKYQTLVTRREWRSINRHFLHR